MDQHKGCKELPAVSGNEQPLANDFLGPKPQISSSNRLPGSSTYVASGDARQIVGTVSTTFTGPIEKFEAHFADMRPETRSRRLLEWLRPSLQSTVHQNVLKSRTKGTGQWFLESSAFKCWITTPASLMWVHGSDKKIDHCSCYPLKVKL